MSSPCVGEREAEVQCFKTLEKQKLHWLTSWEKAWAVSSPSNTRFISCLWWQTPFAREVCVVCPSPGQGGVVTSPAKVLPPDLELAGPTELKGLKPFPPHWALSPALARGWPTEWQGRKVFLFSLVLERELEVVMFWSLSPFWPSALF